MIIKNDTAYVRYCTDNDLKILNGFAKNPTERKRKNLMKKVDELKKLKDENDFCIYAKPVEIERAINAIYFGLASSVAKEEYVLNTKSFKIPDLMTYGKCFCNFEESQGIPHVTITEDVDIAECEMILSGIRRINRGDATPSEILDEFITYLDSVDEKDLSFDILCDFVRMFRALIEFYECTSMFIVVNKISIKMLDWCKPEK